MDELRESSLLFSLEGLLDTERQRVQREAREAQKQREEELRQLAEAAERRSEQARLEREARERRAAIERERERLEQDRREALKLATVERARIEAEAALRLVEAEQARQHELELARLRAEQGTSRYRTLSWLSSGALGLVLAAAFTAHFAWIAPAHARAEQHLTSLVREGAQRSRATELALELERKSTSALRARVAELEARLAKPVVAPAPSLEPAPTSKIAVRHTPPPPKLPRCRDSGDPLDDCLR